MEHTTPPPSPDFDQFLQNVTRETQAADEAKLLHLSLSRQLIEALESRGVLIVVDLDDGAQSDAASLFFDNYKVNNLATIEASYYADPSLQEDMSLLEYARFELKSALLEEFKKQRHLIDTAVDIMKLPIDYETQSREKKLFIASQVVDGTIAPGDEWYSSLNDLLPGDVLDLESEDGQSYIAEALVTYAQNEVLRTITARAAPEIVQIAQDAFRHHPDESTAIDALIYSTSAIIIEYMRSPIAGEAFVDDVVRDLDGPRELAISLKRFGQTYALEVNAERERLQDNT